MTKKTAGMLIYRIRDGVGSLHSVGYASRPNACFSAYGRFFPKHIGLPHNRKRLTTRSSLQQQLPKGNSFETELFDNLLASRFARNPVALTKVTLSQSCTRLPPCAWATRR